MTPESKNLTPAVATSLELGERLKLANELFQEFRSQCFWHSPHDLVITEDLIPFVIKGLRTHGGRRGFMLASKLQPAETTRSNGDRELPECR